MGRRSSSSVARLCMSRGCSGGGLRPILLVCRRLLEDDGNGLMEGAGKLIGGDRVLELGARLVVLGGPKPEQELGARRPALQPACCEVDMSRCFQVDT